MLKTLFPLEIRTMNTSYEIQFGTVERPNHRNTIWDQAQFEVPAQQWADMSEAGYGVSLINDCKYGYSARKNIIMLSLLRSPTQPDPNADQGYHQFTYALYPHVGDWRSGTIAQAKRLNHPLRATPLSGTGNMLPVEFGLVKSPTPGIVIDTVKKAEDSDALIVRIYEGHGGRTKTHLEFGMPIESAEEVNILEETIGLVDRKANQLHFDLKPYQIRTFKVELGKPVPDIG